MRNAPDALGRFIGRLILAVAVVLLLLVLIMTGVIPVSFAP